MAVNVDQLLSSLAPDIGLDLGTANIPVLERGRGVTLREPSYVAVDRQRDNKVLAVGSRARRMFGRTPSHIEVIRPVREGVIADYDLAQSMIRHLLERTRSRGLFRPRVMVGIPSAATDVERRAVSEATRSAGARAVYLVSQPLAAAIGAGLPVLEARGSMIVDIGGGTTQAAVISMGSLVVSGSSRVAGDRMDEAIVAYLRRVHNLLVGERSAEELKIAVGSALPSPSPQRAVVRGRDLQSGLPTALEVDSNELCEVLGEHVRAIGELVRGILEDTPAELVSDIVESGIALCGGGSLLREMDEFLGRVTGVYCYRVDDPLSCVAMGTEKLFSDPRLRRAVLRGAPHGRG
jgi:rod shape-determining protein MreB